MTRSFGPIALLDALDVIGAAAVAHRTRLEIAIYGGSALMLARNFRFSTEDVDITELDEWPTWLTETVSDIATQNGWVPDWLNEAVTFHLSPLANAPADHMVYGSFPRDGAPGLVVSVPSADYMLALKLKAMRTTDPAKGPLETDDIFQLMRIVGIDNADQAMQILACYFPTSAQDTAKQRFLLKHLKPSVAARSHRCAPLPWPRRAGEPTGEPLIQAFAMAIGDFLQSYYLAPGPAARSRCCTTSRLCSKTIATTRSWAAWRNISTSAGRPSARRPGFKTATAISTGHSGRSARATPASWSMSSSPAPASSRAAT